MKILHGICRLFCLVTVLSGCRAPQSAELRSVPVAVKVPK